jgi:hypothetical protein
MIFNFTFCNCAYADGTDSQDEQYKNSPYKGKADVSSVVAPKIIQGDEVEQSSSGTKKSSFSAGDIPVSMIGMVVGILARLVNILIALQVDLFLGMLTHGTETDPAINGGSAEEVFWFSIDRCVFNRTSLFNINYLKTGSYQVGNTTISGSQGNDAIKDGVANVYYLCRIIAMILSLLVLIYIGIRMAISTVASDQARYKKMFISWVESIIILFVMPYIITAIITVGESLTNVFYYLRGSILGGEETFETVVRNEAWPGLFEKSGFDLALWSLIYWCLLFLQIKFFLIYARRLLMVGLLIATSPLIIITYSLDKAGDGRAQAFGNWIKEFLIAVLIQPLHALTYLVFVLTANEIASRSPLVALALLLAMTTVERMVRVIFKMSSVGVVKEMKLLKKGG